MVAQSVAEILRNHVSLSVEGIDRMYLNVYVPTLQRDDGSVLTEFPAIATWLARKNPETGLLPSDADGEAR